MQKSEIKGLTLNGTSIVVVTLNSMVILNRLDCISKVFDDKMDGKILVASMDVGFAFEILISSSVVKVAMRFDQLKMLIKIVLEANIEDNKYP